MHREPLWFLLLCVLLIVTLVTYGPPWPVTLIEYMIAAIMVVSAASNSRAAMRRHRPARLSSGLFPLVPNAIKITIIVQT